MQTLDISELIDERPVGSFQYRVLILCMSVLFLDGYDTQAIGYVAPGLVQSWHIDKAALAPIFAAGLVGLMIGGLVFGPLADRFGRKNFILASVALFGLFSLLSALAASADQMLVMRFLTGLGLGGAMPNAVALGVEYLPRRKRASAVTIIFVGFTLGAASGGFLAAHLMAGYGWPAVFVIGGTLPLALLVLLAIALPESIAFMILRRYPERKIQAILMRLDESLKSAQPIKIAMREENRQGVPVKHLFNAGRGAATLLLWLIFFLALLDTFLVTSWMPIAFGASGLRIDQAVNATAMWQVGAIIGTLTVGQAMDRADPYLVLAGAFGLGALAAIGLTNVSAAMPFWLVLAATAAAGACQSAGGTQGANALAGWYYPTFIRSTGVGWALGFGRIGSIIGSLLGGFLIILHLQPNSIFWVAAIGHVSAAIATMFMRRQGRAAELPRLEPAVER